METPGDQVEEDLPDDDEESVEREERVAALAEDDSTEADDGAD